MLVRRWEQIITMRQNVQFVQVISWNDYGESHYLCPPRGAQPNSQSWVDGCPHESWLSLNAYFIRAFKEGQYPPIGEIAGCRPDKIWLWARPHLRDGAATEDEVERPDNWQLADDFFDIVVITAPLPGPITLIISNSQEDLHPAVYQLPPNERIFKLSHPMTPGKSMRAELRRNGAIVAVCTPGETESFKFDPRPKVYNFNAFVCTSV